MQLSVTAEKMTPKLSGLKQQQIDFVHYFARQNSAGKLGPTPRGIICHDSMECTSRWHITELASWCWLLDPLHVGISIRWLKLPSRMVAGVLDEGSQEAESRSCPFLSLG